MLPAPARRVWSKRTVGPAVVPGPAVETEHPPATGTADQRILGLKPEVQACDSESKKEDAKLFPSCSDPNMSTADEGALHTGAVSPAVEESTSAEVTPREESQPSAPLEESQAEAAAAVSECGDAAADSANASASGEEATADAEPTSADAEVPSAAPGDEEAPPVEGKKRRTRIRARNIPEKKEREVEPKVDAKEDRATTETELLQNAISWCRSLLPKEVERKEEKADIAYDAPGGAQVLVQKSLRDEVFYLEPALKKGPRKVKTTKAKEAVIHTAETLHIFKYLKLQAPLLVADVAPTLAALERLASGDRLTADMSSADDGQAATKTEGDTLEAPGGAPAMEECETPEGSVSILQGRFDSLAQKLGTVKSSEFAFKRLALRLEELGRSVEPYFVNVLPQILKIAGNTEIGESSRALELIELFFSMMSPYAIDLLMPALLTGLDNKAKPTLKMLTLSIIAKLAEQFPDFIRCELVNLVAPVAELTCDAKKKVAEAAVECMRGICACTGNKDLEPFLPFVVEAAQSISNTRACVEQLAGCIFVQNVEAPALAATLPVLCRGLNDRSEEVVRTCCQIVDNMCKLVEDPAEVVPLLPQLEPLVRSAVERIADPEARGIAEKALGTLQKVAGKDTGTTRVTRERSLEIVMAVIKEKRGTKRKAIPREVLHHVAGLVAMATNMRRFDSEDWRMNVGFFASFRAIIDAIRGRMETTSMQVEEVEEEDEGGVDLYKGSFSLAYGTLTLLRDARMHLKRNRFYGLLGPNQCGKTTLMRAIANEQLEGFPTRAELKSVFVEHEIEDEEVGVQDDGFPIMSVDKPGWWWVMHTCNDIYKLEVPVSEEQVKKLMIETGFGYTGGPDRAANLENPVTTYSGGWKMKMQLCAAKLMEADVLMLDEPTGHLDVDNIRWLEDWLEEFPGSVICVSHFSPFLDKMCTHIIDFQDRKLKTFKGVKGATLTKFVERFPDKKSYFELSNECMKFTFSVPGPLAGVKSRSKTILRMNSVTHCYPTKKNPTIKDVSLTVSQVSRVAVIGANGAGKTTAIKILMGEIVPTEGSIWKSPGLRLAYVAQHALHHLEKHMHETPAQYIMWRFAGDEDKESLEFKSDSLNVDEEAARAVSWCIDGVSGDVRLAHEEEEDPKKAKQDLGSVVVPEAILNRRTRKRDKMNEYEVKWAFKPVENACWVERDILVQMGYLKLVQREDEKQAAMSGLMTKQLTQPCIEKHLKEFGVDAESASHTMISQLSGGLKVKVVLAAAMWQNPHVLVLDEPTNYLDREGLGALSLAINDFQGGIVVISHNKEFCDSVATEKWIMAKGMLRIEGESVETGEQAAAAVEQKDHDIFDGAGNKITVRSAATLSDKQKKKDIKDLESKLKDKSTTLSDEQRWELQDKLAALKSDA